MVTVLLVALQAMMHAASRGYGHIVRHLVEAGADGGVYNLSGQTAADLALANGFHAVSGERGRGQREGGGGVVTLARRRCWRVGVGSLYRWQRSVLFVLIAGAEP